MATPSDKIMREGEGKVWSCPHCGHEAHALVLMQGVDKAVVVICASCKHYGMALPYPGVDEVYELSGRVHAYFLDNDVSEPIAGTTAEAL